MSFTNKDSIGKIVGYFKAVTKVPFTYKGKTVAPLPLEVLPSLAKGFDCPDNCGACCCDKFTLDYIDGDGEGVPDGLKKREVRFNGKKLIVLSDQQLRNWSDRCKYLLPENARCDIHGVHPFTCAIELVRVRKADIRNYNTIGVMEFGRSWQLSRASGEKGTLCKILKATPATVADSVAKLERLRTWATFFGLTETWVPEIIDYLQTERYLNGSIILGGEGAELYEKPKEHPGKELLQSLIKEGTHTRPEIMDTLTAAHPDVPKTAFAAWLTSAKNPKYNPFDKEVVIDAAGIWKFED